MLRLNVGCGPHPAGVGWTNIDVEATFNPDVVASIIDLPYEDGTVGRLYAGHCLEHLSLQNGCDGDSTFTAGMHEVRRVLAPDGVACFVCPDVYRALEWWKTGQGDWALVEACLEGPDGGIAAADAWDGCFHAWNCHETRLLDLVRATFPEAVAVPMASPELAAWPLVSNVGWQCCVITKAP